MKSHTSWHRPIKRVSRYLKSLTLGLDLDSYILSQGGKRKRPYDTVLPLANALGISVDTSCDRDDHECVARVVENYEGPGDILIWYVHPVQPLLVIEYCVNSRHLKSAGSIRPWTTSSRRWERWTYPSIQSQTTVSSGRYLIRIRRLLGLRMRIALDLGHKG